MNMQHGRLAPAAVAAVLALSLGAAFVARYGLAADFAHDASALLSLLAVVFVPGVGAAAFAILRELVDVKVAVAPKAKEAAMPPASVVAPAGLAGVGLPSGNIDTPVPVAAHAAADIPSLTEVRVERRQRERRAASAPRLKLPVAG